MAESGMLPRPMGERAMPMLHQMHDVRKLLQDPAGARQVGVPLTLLDYPLHGGETRKAPFLAKNPNGRVPMLELDDGRCLPESGAILWYLSEGTALQPADKWGRAQALQWMFFEQYSHEPYIAVARFWLALRAERGAEKKRALVPEWHAKGNAALGVMETHLRTRLVRGRPILDRRHRALRLHPLRGGRRLRSRALSGGARAGSRASPRSRDIFRCRSAGRNFSRARTESSFHLSNCHGP
jgi:glutathione S-transferase